MYIHRTAQTTIAVILPVESHQVTLWPARELFRATDAVLFSLLVLTGRAGPCELSLLTLIQVPPSGPPLCMSGICFTVRVYGDLIYLSFFPSSFCTSPFFEPSSTILIAVYFCIEDKYPPCNPSSCPVCPSNLNHSIRSSRPSPPPHRLRPPGWTSGARRSPPSGPTTPSSFSPWCGPTPLPPGSDVIGRVSPPRRSMAPAAFRFDSERPPRKT